MSLVTVLAVHGSISARQMKPNPRYVHGLKRKDVRKIFLRAEMLLKESSAEII